MNIRFRPLIFLGLLFAWTLPSRAVEAKSYIAYISDSTNSSVIYWIAKEAGILRSTASISIRFLSTAVCAAFRA